MLTFTKITRPQLLAVTGWSKQDLDNRVHHNQLALAHGLRLPLANGVYLGADCFALLLSDKVVEAGFTRSLAGRFVRDGYPKWLSGLERIEWQNLFPPPVPTHWAPTPTGIAEGYTEFPPDVQVYFSIHKHADGDFEIACGTQANMVTEWFAAMTREPSRKPPVQVTQINLRLVYEATLAAAQKVGVDLGAPFTRPEGHPEHKEWFAEVHAVRALSLARMKQRKPPGPPPRGTRKAKARGRRPARVPDGKRLLKV